MLARFHRGAQRRDVGRAVRIGRHVRGRGRARPARSVRQPPGSGTSCLPAGPSRWSARKSPPAAPPRRRSSPRAICPSSASSSRDACAEVRKRRACARCAGRRSRSRSLTSRSRQLAGCSRPAASFTQRPLQAVVGLDEVVVEAADVAHPVAVDVGVVARRDARQPRPLRPLGLGLQPRGGVAALRAERADRVRRHGLSHGRDLKR